MAYKLVALDLDGTIINSSGQISPRTVAAVRRARQAGLLVMVATGRRLRAAMGFLGTLGLEGPAILCNGALALDLTTWRTLAHRPLGASGTAAVRSWLEAGLLPLVCRHTLTGAERLYSALGPVPTGWPVSDVDPMGPTDDLPAAAATALKLLTIVPDGEVAGLRSAGAALGQHLASPLHNGTSMVELWGGDVSKAMAVAEIARRAGIDRSEIIAFGDNRNDVEMLAYAGLGVATANATADALSAADQVCGACDDDGVAEVLESLVKPVRAAM